MNLNVANKAEDLLRLTVQDENIVYIAIQSKAQNGEITIIVYRMETQGLVQKSVLKLVSSLDIPLPSVSLFF